MKNINKFDGMFLMTWFYYIYKNLLLTETSLTSENRSDETIMTGLAYLSIFYFLFRVSRTSYTWHQESNFKNFKQLAQENYKNKKYDLAKTNYEKALKYGSDDYVEYSLGWLYEHGEGVTKNLTEAKRLYRLAKEHGSLNATKQLLLIEEGAKISCNSTVRETWSSIGNKYFSGKDRIKNYENAKICYEQGINNETDGIAEHHMGLLYEQGFGLKVDSDSALDWYKKSLQKGYQPSGEKVFQIEIGSITSSSQAFDLGEEYYYGRGKNCNYSYAKQCFEKALSYGSNAHAEYILGRLYEHGQGMEKNLAKAKHWYKLAKEHGSFDATKQLVLIEEGPKVKSLTETWSSIGNKYYYGKNYVDARICYEQGANNEINGFAEYNMGLLYEQGFGLKADSNSALDWYKKSLQKGYQPSGENIFQIEIGSITSSSQAFDLGEEYYYGKKRELNYSYARKCYEKALTFDLHIGSVYSLGWIFHHGKGTTVDLSAALALYAHAAIKGHKDAAIQLKKIKDRELCRKQAKEYYNSASWLLWGLSLFDTSSLVENIATTFILPVVDLGANTVGQPWISTTASYITLSVSFLANPISFSARKATSAVLYKIIDNLELTNPSAEATLMLLADYSSCFVARKITSLILDPKVVLEEENSNNNGNSNNKNSEEVDNANNNENSSNKNSEEADDANNNGNSSNKNSEEIDNKINKNSSSYIFNANSQIFRQMEEDVVEVYYFSQPLSNKFFRPFQNIDKRARHVGIIIKDANGYTKIELALDKHKESRLSVTAISEIQEGNSLNDMWIYKAGTTKLNSAQLIDHADQWIKDNPEYKFNNKNCRSLTDNLLFFSIINNGKKYRDESVKINTHNFKKSPCEECEHRFEKDGTNFHK